METVFEGQSYEPLRRIISSTKIQEIQGRIKVSFNKESIDWTALAKKLTDLGQSDWKPQYLIAIDGDYSKSVIENGYPGAEVGYITISTVIIYLDKVREIEKEKFIDPVKFKETEKPTSIDSLIVGSNVVLNGENSAMSSMRKLLFDELKQYQIFTGSETLLNTYEALLKIRLDAGVGRPAKCPNETCDADYKYGFGEYLCPVCGGKLYSTDALRLHELLNLSGTSGEMYGQIKETFKKLQLLHILRSLASHAKYFPLLRDTAFFSDGTLAVFSTASWLAIPIRSELWRINDLVRKEFNLDLIVIGIERSGSFVNHFRMIDTKRNGNEDNFPAQSVFLPDNNYIKENIEFNNKPDFVYLKDTSFGRKFFYKTQAGYRVVPSIATYNSFQANPLTANVAQFPRLHDVLALLDKLVSNRYENSIVPLATAHAEASIPLNLGKRVFDDIADQIKRQPPSSARG